MSSQVKVEIISSIQFPTAQPNVKRKTRDQFRQDLGNIGALVQALGCSFFWPTCWPVNDHNDTLCFILVY